jgi:hypothetical protein
MICKLAGIAVREGLGLAEELGAARTLGGQKTPKACQNHEKQLETDCGQSRFPVVSRDFDKLAPFLMTATFFEDWDRH